MSLEERSSPVELNGFVFEAAKLGCSQLVEVKKAEESFCGKLLPTTKLSEFLQLEGLVHKVLRAHPHPNILPPLCVASGKETSGIIFPSLGEDLHSIARAAKGLSEREVKPLFHSILSAVHHCHSNRIVIRDLRLGKIFFKKGTREVVLADLDGAQMVNPASPFLSDRKGSPAFVSPEVVVSQSYDGAAADMWALGVILYILLTGTYPFRDTHPANLFHKIQQGHQAVFFPPNMSEAPRDILRRLLVKEPHLRLTADELMKDLWFAGPITPSSSKPHVSCPPAPAAIPVAHPSSVERVVAPKRPCADELPSTKRFREAEVDSQLS
eukprot:m.54599 g.54599  ORF g.54599 m.54599 type:complete len:325 (-) comp6604_c1_seq1:1878-2852(-)